MIKKTTASDAPAVQAAVDGKIMYSDKELEIVLLTLKPGESIPLHKNPFDVVFACVCGEATLTTPDNKLSISKGETIFVSADEERMWENNSKGVFQVFVIKLINE